VQDEEGWGANSGRQFMVTRAPYHDADGKLAGVISFACDVTEQRRLAEHLRQTQKLESIGRLAGGIAHDFNNLMTIVLGYADALECGDGPEGSAPGYIVEIKRAAERAALLTRQLLAFSRQQMLRPKVLDPNWVIANMDRMLRRVIGEDIELHTRLSPDAGHVRVDPGQMEQVLLNIVLNARDAMPKGGSLSIETANVELTEDLLRHQPDARPGKYVLVSVSDTGCGMDRETLARAFEPFFTTKGSAGTGLGLATVHGIVKQSDGEVWAYSEPDCGTSTNVYLPRVDQPAEGPAPDPRARPSGEEHILLVEDEAPVRQLLVRTLKRFGYTVEEAEDGREALKLLQERKGAFTLLITDAVMPFIGGRELAEQVGRMWPDIRVLFISGYAGGQDGETGGAISGLFLQKPFTAATLAAKVREALDAPREGGM
jgi:two-component system cell cycle sensor histidine kinase/response regulator CckA